ncbi:MAG: SDR family NAD(P)-dependent oxidoreductase [Saprospirales bacterium]|nr:SDR family NAD(P)-dependent oxidoreductase [Saprospirales bacterium]
MKTAVVTGANRGIGKEIARQLIQKGFRVVLTARDLEKAKRAAAEIGGEPIALELDVARDDSAEAFGILLRDRVDRVDVLINNAGILGRLRLLDFDIQEIHEVLETNLFGALRTTKMVLPLMPESAESRIINISSEMGAWRELRGGHAGYRLSKVSLNAFTAMLAHELRNTSIKVNAMCPGWVRTEMGGPGASRPVEKGAETAIWLATEAEIPSGKFFSDKKEVSW